MAKSTRNKATLVRAAATLLAVLQLEGDADNSRKVVRVEVHDDVVFTHTEEWPHIGVRGSKLIRGGSRDLFDPENDELWG